MSNIVLRMSEETKRYTVDYVISKDNKNFIMIWDNFKNEPTEKHGERLGRFPSLDDKCREMNLKFEDDLRYLDEIKKL